MATIRMRLIERIADGHGRKENVQAFERALGELPPENPPGKDGNPVCLTVQGQQVDVSKASKSTRMTLYRRMSAPERIAARPIVWSVYRETIPDARL